MQNKILQRKQIFSYKFITIYCESFQMVGNKTNIAVVEFIGTFFLSVILYVVNINAKRYGPLIIGLTLAIAISLAWNISGGHFNPAVTIMSTVNGSIDSRLAVIYIVVQICGALAAVAFAKYTFGKS